METIKAVVKNIMQGWEKEKAVLIEPQVLLKKVLTKKELGHIRVHYFKKGILNVSVDSSTWFYYFMLQKKRILSRLIAESRVIKDIRFRIGEVR